MACEASSLRSVAAQVGMTPMGLRGFIRGENAPQPRTVRKLTAWYARRMQALRPGGEEATRASLIALATLYPPADRSRVEKLFLDLMEDQFRESGMPPPPWFGALRSGVGEETD